MTQAARAKPKFLQQPAGSPTCWAFALSSWMGISADRTPTPPASIIAACKNFTNPTNGGLFPDKFPLVAESMFVKMGWKVINGADWPFQEVVRLLKQGWIYAVLDEPGGVLLLGGAHFAHARVVYGVTDERGFGPELMAIDPILGDMIWSTTDIRKQKLMLGFAQELLSPDPKDKEIKGRDGATISTRQWLVKIGGNQVTRFTPPE